MFIGLFFYTIYHDCVSEPKRLEKKFRNIGKEEKEDLENDHDEGYFRHPE